ncbi:PP2C family protein-serine/threonine phosphatase [Paraherbaspirillum soli]|uniref:PP2C family protein-serine/threonine phosphatase n=1 Tax=Paraherbaspirillum soli TaxID=631222 RepID=A0ABW0M8E4_9BURK
MTCLHCGDSGSAAGSKFCEGCGQPLLPLTSQAVPAAKDALACACSPAASAPDADGFCNNCGVRCIVAVSAASAAGVSNAHYWCDEPDARLAMISDIGRRHSHNEDCGSAGLSPNNAAVLVVADGVSSSFHSAQASATAVELVSAGLSAHDGTLAQEDVMHSAIMAAHQAIMQLPAGAAANLDEPECTLVAALVADGTATIGWVGDSRAYLISGNAERCLTVDDSWVEEVVAAGLYSRAAASADRRAHYVTQVLGMRDGPVAVHVLSTGMAADDVLLLCSDGLWNYFQQDGSLAARVGQIKQELGVDVSAKAVCQALVDDANAQGGHDNITVAMLMGRLLER